MNKIVLLTIFIAITFLLLGCLATNSDYENDKISLVQNLDGTFVCVGCGPDSSGATFCADPLPDAEFIPETPERYCNGFNVVEN